MVSFPAKGFLTSRWITKSSILLRVSRKKRTSVSNMYVAVALIHLLSSTGKRRQSKKPDGNRGSSSPKATHTLRFGEFCHEFIFPRFCKVIDSSRG